MIKLEKVSDSKLKKNKESCNPLSNGVISTLNFQELSLKKEHSHMIQLKKKAQIYNILKSHSLAVSRVQLPRLSRYSTHKCVYNKGGYLKAC